MMRPGVLRFFRVLASEADARSRRPRLQRQHAALALHLIDEALKLAKRACELNDTLGCYNQGCYECLYQKDVTAAFKSLELAVKLGYRNVTSLENDPDLECLRKSKNWDAFLKKISHDLDHQFQIHHATLQIEIGDGGGECRLEPDDVV